MCHSRASGNKKRRTRRRGDAEQTTKTAKTKGAKEFTHQRYGRIKFEEYFCAPSARDLFPGVHGTFGGQTLRVSA
jgi:hypothetical protein